LPHALTERYGIEVVPLTVTVNDVDYLDGVDLDADDFWATYRDGMFPTVATSQPSPGQFAIAYEELAARGCTEILSIHVTSAVSGTINAARLAAHSVPLPVRVVDSGTASVGVSCCVWAAAAAVSIGACVNEAAAIAERVAPTVGNVFLVGSDVVCLHDGAVRVVQHAATPLDAINAMARLALSWGTRLRVAVGHSDPATAPLADALEEAISEAADVLDVVRYRVGPSIGAHTGPGTVGCFMFPSELLPA
jgi:fatty acid-binding protein DegV